MRQTRYLTAKELAHRWRLPLGTLSNWRYMRRGPDFIKISSRVIYPLETIEAYEREHLVSCEGAGLYSPVTGVDVQKGRWS